MFACILASNLKFSCYAEGYRVFVLFERKDNVRRNGARLLEYDKCDQLFPHLTVPAEANATSACRADVEGGFMYK